MLGNNPLTLGFSLNINVKNDFFNQGDLPVRWTSSGLTSEPSTTYNEVKTLIIDEWSINHSGGKINRIGGDDDDGERRFYISHTHSFMELDRALNKFTVKKGAGGSEARHIKYTSKLERILRGRDVTRISYHDSPKLFFATQDIMIHRFTHKPPDRQQRVINHNV